MVHSFTDSRANEHARKFLRAWRGKLMGYKAGFDPGISKIACVDHARRRFYDLARRFLAHTHRNMNPAPPRALSTYRSSSMTMRRATMAQKAFDGVWVTLVSSCHAVALIASCLR
ncbi:transposase [Burkholderia sp. Ac-20353]|nr:transposase [Burkholderia sp. Ac-20353]